jgi:2-polyprenyl-3-methyl-5-hydroxy-6-metoxy-1,4-benzoquinol methylase
MQPDLSVRAADARELMDAPDADLRMLEHTYRRFGIVNRLVSRPGALYRRDVRPRAGTRPLRILDIGAGGGDLCRFLAQRLRRDGVRAEITALDPDERAMAWARRNDAGAGVTYRVGFSGDLVSEGRTFHLVLSNHLLHHLTAEELRALLRDSTALVAPGGLVAHHDIARSRAAYALFAAATLPFASSLFAGSFIRADGLTSIRRSYTAEELRAAVPPGWRVATRVPARLELRWEPRDDGP